MDEGFDGALDLLVRMRRRELHADARLAEAGEEGVGWVGVRVMVVGGARWGEM